MDTIELPRFNNKSKVNSYLSANSEAHAFSSHSFNVFCLNNLLSTSSNPLLKDIPLRSSDSSRPPPPCPQQMKRHVKANSPLVRKRFCTCKRLHVLHELIHTKFPICTFDIFILFLLYSSSDTYCLALTYRPRQCKKAGFMYLTSFFRD